jgi:glycosyltransferase involved in cell wall biosynthesis
MYVDGYLPQAKVWADMVFSEAINSAATASIPWAGLCVTPEQISEQQASQTLPRYYQLTGYQGTCFLDEALLQSYRTHYPTKHFEFLPDITETDLPTTPNPLALDIKRQAAGRTIVFMGGSIGKQKNLARWVDMVLNLDPAQWYFVQIGRINVNNLTPADEQALALLKQQQPANLYIHADYLPDETVFNAIIAASDVIFAVYRGFYRSSNMLSKAAYFEKPILVADRCLMGERVTKYEIGLAVPADHAECIQAGLASLLKLEGLANKFANYRADFNGSEFSRRLETFAKNCLSKDQVVN